MCTPRSRSDSYSSSRASRTSGTSSGGDVKDGQAFRGKPISRGRCRLPIPTMMWNLEGDWELKCRVYGGEDGPGRLPGAAQPAAAEARGQGFAGRAAAGFEEGASFFKAVEPKAFPKISMGKTTDRHRRRSRRPKFAYTSIHMNYCDNVRTHVHKSNDGPSYIVGPRLPSLRASMGP